MDVKEILNWCVNQGILLDPETLELLKESEDNESVKLILNKIKTYTNSRVITKSLFEKNLEKTQEFFLTLPEENQKKLERVKIKLGLQIEISKETSKQVFSKTPELGKQFIPEESHLQKISNSDAEMEKIQNQFPSIKVFSKTPSLRKKIEVKDFVGTFRDRFSKIRGILQEHSKLDSLVSINKIANIRKRGSIIGMVSNKRITKNKNILLEVEDFTGKIRVLISINKPELLEKAEEIPLDSVIGFNGYGDREIIFVNDIILPEAFLAERKKSNEDESVLFISDLHFGSKHFFEKDFLKFIDFLSGKGSNGQESEKIKYLFVGGDLIAGVGNYPGQEKDLKIKGVESQFQELADLFSKIRKDIKIIISPGNHDGVRLMEPQPILDEKYAWPIYNLKNVVLTGNPSFVNIGAKKNFPGFDILSYHGFSFPYYANNIPSLIKSTINSPEKIMAYLLQHRHLAPTFTSNQTLPAGEDCLVVDKIPDCRGTHPQMCSDLS